MDHKGNLISKLFHYTSYDAGKEILKSCALKTSRPSKFNDPLEFLPSIKKSTDYSDSEFDGLWSQHKEQNTSLYQTGIETWNLAGRPGTFLDFARSNTHPEYINYQLGTERHFRIICCTARPNIIPMWAHYGGNHTGVVFEFELTTLPFSGLLEAQSIVPVNYSAERIFYDHMRDELLRHKQEQTGTPGIFFEIASRKDISWSVEEEIRIILPVGIQNNPQLREHFFIQDNELFLKLKPSSFKAIYCGMRMEEKNRIELQTFATDQLGWQVPIIQVGPSATSYDFHPFCSS